MEWKRILFMAGMLLVMATTGLEIVAWWKSNQSDRRAGVLGVLNLVAIILLVAGS